MEYQVYLVPGNFGLGNSIYSFCEKAINKSRGVNNYNYIYKISGKIIHNNKTINYIEGGPIPPKPGTFRTSCK